MWWSAETDISGRLLLNARPCYSLALPTMPQKRLYSEASFGLLARLFPCGTSKYAKWQAKSRYGG
jgi:hypothetical protein